MIVSIMEAMDGSSWWIVFKDKLIKVTNPMEALTYFEN